MDVVPDEERRSSRRPPIPLPMQRAVRQRCGFGCVICGQPLYEYHHMTPFAEVQRHTQDNLTLLCDSHHREATNGLLTPEKIAESNRTPRNVKVGVSSPFALHFSGSEFEVNIGGCVFTGGVRHQDGGISFVPISVDDHDFVSFRIDNDGRMFVNASILDECNLPLLEIAENALVYRADIWDIEFRGTKLALRQAPREIFLEIEFNPPNGIRLLRGRLLCNGVEILIHPERYFIVNAGQTFSMGSFRGGAIGLQLGRNARGLPSCARGPERLKRYGVDREALITTDERIAKEIKAQFESSASKESTRHK